MITLGLLVEYPLWTKYPLWTFSSNPVTSPSLALIFGHFNIWNFIVTEVEREFFKKVGFGHETAVRLDKLGFTVFAGCLLPEGDGFGHETAVRLDKLGFTVFAGCLLPEGDGAKKLRKTGSKRLHVLHLDVTKDEHVQKSVAYVSKNCQNSGLWAVINNAAINRCCDIELASIELMKRVAEVNYYGTARVTKACINMLRQSGGRVINVSSVRGRVALPTDVSYTCTKWAVEAFSDILRREMRRFGVKVAIIEPGNFGGITGMLMPKTIASMEEELSSAWDASSADTKKAYGRQYIDALLGSFHSTGQSSHATMEPVIAAMEDAVTSASPRHRYLVSGGTKLLDWYTVAAVLNSYLPEVLMDYLIRVFEPLPPVDFSTRLSH